ncbi:unnamed protein product [Adineta steineri]|uniref:F-box domain-containing protein n=1 Tax=Adineta steineri TaxID=433720 RepID=A0A813P419_9BILA|nr:unnamed protein product [Adineta steineri]
MERFSIESKLEILPDEILLEICQYLLCVDILQSFYGLNSRMTLVDIQPNENLVTNAKQWLQENTILQQEQFNADFNRELKRLVIWM